VFVLVTDDSGYDYDGLASIQRALWGDDAYDAIQARLPQRPDTSDDTRPLLKRGQRVFGPFKTYDEGKCAAMTLGFQCDYWVIEVEKVGTAEES